MTDFDQSTNETRHAVWERAHQIGSPTHRLRTALVLRAVSRVERDDARLRLGTEPDGSQRGACLDAGCGTGEFSTALALRGWRVTGFDPSGYAIEIARQRAQNVGAGIDLAVATLDDFVCDDRFDMALSVDVLEHIEDDAAAMATLASFVRPGGALVVTVPMDPELWSAADDFSGHFRRYTRESLECLATGAGLAVEQTSCYGYPFTRMMWRAKKRVPSADSHVVEAGASGGPLRRVAAKCVSRTAVALTSIDRLFPRARNGVGLLVVCRKPT